MNPTSSARKPNCNTKKANNEAETGGKSFLDYLNSAQSDQSIQSQQKDGSSKPSALRNFLLQLRKNALKLRDPSILNEQLKKLKMLKELKNLFDPEDLEKLAGLENLLQKIYASLQGAKGRDNNGEDEKKLQQLFGELDLVLNSLLKKSGLNVAGEGNDRLQAVPDPQNLNRIDRNQAGMYKQGNSVNNPVQTEGTSSVNSVLQGQDIAEKIAMQGNHTEISQIKAGIPGEKGSFAEPVKELSDKAFKELKNSFNKGFLLDRKLTSKQSSADFEGALERVLSGKGEAKTFQLKDGKVSAGLLKEGQAEPSIRPQGEVLEKGMQVEARPLDRFQLYDYSVEQKGVAVRETLPAGVGEQVLAKVRTLLTRNEKKAELQLHPKELGKIQIELKISEKNISARFVVENSEVRSLLQSQIHQLKKALNQQGWNWQEGTVDYQQQDFSQSGGFNRQGGGESEKQFSDNGGFSGNSDGFSDELFDAEEKITDIYNLKKVNYLI